MARSRNKQILFFVNEQEYKDIQARVKLSGLDRSQYMRLMALKGIIYNEDLESTRQLSYEINKIGTNINQITKQVNETGAIYYRDIKYIERKMEEIYEKLSELMKSDSDKKIREAIRKELKKIKKEIKDE